MHDCTRLLHRPLKQANPANDSSGGIEKGEKLYEAVQAGFARPALAACVRFAHCHALSATLVVMRSSVEMGIFFLRCHAQTLLAVQVK